MHALRFTASSARRKTTPVTGSPHMLLLSIHAGHGRAQDPHAETSFQGDSRAHASDDRAAFSYLLNWRYKRTIQEVCLLYSKLPTLVIAWWGDQVPQNDKAMFPHVWEVGRRTGEQPSFRQRLIRGQKDGGYSLLDKEETIGYYSRSQNGVRTVHDNALCCHWSMPVMLDWVVVLVPKYTWSGNQ